MTTLKEYKAMMECATAAPWSQSHRADVGGYYTQVYCAKGETIATLSWYKKSLGNGATGTHREANAKFIAASRNIAPELIRVIELAEEGLDYALSQMQPFCSDEKVKQALSEIRKLKGE